MKHVVARPLESAGANAVVEELPARLDAWQVFKLLAGLPHAAFLDSAMPHPELGRYSYITGDPFEWLTVPATDQRTRIGQGSRDSLGWLQERLANYALPALPDLPPFQSGAICMFGYDLCHEFEELPDARLDEFQTPLLAIGFYDWVIAFDHVESRSWLISTGMPEKKEMLRRRRAEKRAAQVMRWLASGVDAKPFPIGQAPGNLAPMHRIDDGLTFSNFDRANYLTTIDRAIEYIHAGDIFQVNIAQRLLCEARSTPLDLYEKLRLRNPAPFGAYFDLGEFVIASASPERFLRVENREVETRPIKGTRPRGETAESDLAQQHALLASQKDHSENVMIVDLLRNDLGRVCEYGSIQVQSLCQLETYQYVHHLVSQVRGRLRPDKGPVDLLRAAFPGGSVTGAPKIRAMEIIAELEPTARGPYCGSLACIGLDGFMDSNILIRTFTIGRGYVQFPVGGGIVADSEPEREYDETMHKAEGMLKALES